MSSKVDLTRPNPMLIPNQTWVAKMLSWGVVEVQARSWGTSSASTNCCLMVSISNYMMQTMNTITYTGGIRSELHTRAWRPSLETSCSRDFSVILYTIVSQYIPHAKKEKVIFDFGFDPTDFNPKYLGPKLFWLESYPSGIYICAIFLR